MTGPKIIPLSARLTFSTSRACSSMARFLCTMPMPPSRAMAMAARASVTESIAALRSGMFMVSFRVSRVRTSTSAGRYFAVGRQEEDVVERQALSQLVVEHGGF